MLEGRGHGEVWGTSRARGTKSGPEPERDDSIKSGHMVQYVLLSVAFVAPENKKGATEELSVKVGGLFYLKQCSFISSQKTVTRSDYR